MKRNHRKIHKFLTLSTLTLSLSITPLTAYAAQSARWDGTGDTWKVRNATNDGYLANSWFQDDLTNEWYMLGADSIMYAGLVTDISTQKTYLLNTEHDGTYGRMITTDGTYNINGTPVALTFNQNHDGTFGAITSGLSEARSTGVKETALDSIPVDNEATEQTATSSSKSAGRALIEQAEKEGRNLTSEEFASLTEEEKDAYIEEKQGGSVAHPDSIDPYDINWG